MRNKSATEVAATGDLRSRNLRSVQLLAQDMLGRPVGARLPTTIEYQKQLGVGSGTVQKALSILENSGAVALSRHGHLGTRLVELDEGMLWSMSGRGQVRLVLPLPGAIDHFGLVNGLRAEFDRFHVPLDVRHRQGGESRADLVAEGRVDVAVLSKSAADALRRSLRRKLRIVEFGTDLYYTPGSLVVVRRTDAPKRPRKLKVAIDRSSHDHESLTELEFPPGPKHTYVDCPYMEVLKAVWERRVDVAIRHTTLLWAPLASAGLAEAPLTSAATDPAMKDISTAVLAVRRDDSALASLVERLDVDVVAREQAELLGQDPTSSEAFFRAWSP